MNLADLAAAPAPVVHEVTLRGAAVRPRPLTLADTAALRRAYPAPPVPMIPDPSKGSLTREKVPNPHDDAYRRAKAEHLEQLYLAEAVLALDLTLADGRTWRTCADDAARRAYLDAAAAALAALATDAEIAAVAAALAQTDRALASAARESLIVALDAERAQATPPDPLPENYGQTRLYMLLRAAERFGLDPRALAALSAEDERLLLQFERARQQEETRRDEVFLRAACPRL